jgi:ABC-2 type transport system ATP-binding protein
MLTLTTSVLKARGLEKSFGRENVVHGVDLDIVAGEIVGFLGPNGAGKTTVMRMIAGLLAPDRGTVELFGMVNGFRRREIRARISYLQEKPRVYPEMSARSYLSFFANLYGLPSDAGSIGRALDRVGLPDIGRRPLGTFSRGMQQRICLARCLLHEPQLLLLDEPTLGLDPRGVIDMRDIFLGLRNSGVTLMISSHQLSELERIIDRVVFISHGHVIASGPTAEVLAGRLGRRVLEVETENPAEQVRDRVAECTGVVAVRVNSEFTLTVELRADPEKSDRQMRAGLVRELFAKDITPVSVGAPHALEQLFVELTQDGAGQARAATLRQGE